MDNLKTAINAKDVQTVNDLSHRMLSMFKQLKATTVVPLLEALETTTSVSENDYKVLETQMVPFIEELTTYLNQDHTP